MNDDYLWDRSGPPDPEIERLERTLAPLRYQGRGELAGSIQQRPRRRLWWAVAAAAALAAVGTEVMLTRVPTARATSWLVETMQGPSNMGGEAMAVATAVREGQLVRTGKMSQLTLQSESVGKIDVGPDSELRASSGKKVLLQRGEIHAFIWAPPREFVVDTPSAQAVDLGCEYTLKVDSSGNGLLHVDRGWVAFRFDDRESFIPAGGECATRKSDGPGVPFYADASEAMRNGVRAFDAGDHGALTGILNAARPRDALTLWHLLTRVKGQERGRVFDRFVQLVKVPGGVTRFAVIESDRRALDLCWNALELENTEWWRGWERRWN